MSNLDNILLKIKSDATKKADVILDKARKEAEHLAKNADQKALEEKNQIEYRAGLEKERLVEKSISQAKLKARDKVLKAKEEVLQKVLSSVVVDLENLDEKSYIKYLKNNLESVKTDENSVLRVPKNYKEAVKKEFPNIQVSDQYVERGFNLSNGNVVYNSDFKTVIDSKRDFLEAQIAKELFGE